MTSSCDSLEASVAAFHCLMLAMRRGQPAWLDVDLTMAQMRVLASVCAQGESHGRGLAQMLGVGQPAVSKVVDQLVDRGYVCRREDAVDRRVVWLRPTDAGQAFFERITLVGEQAMRSIIKSLAPRETEIVGEAFRVLARAAEQLAKEREACLTREEANELK